MSRKNSDPGYILLRRMNWGWVFTQMMLTMIFLMNGIGMFYFLFGINDPLALVFMVNFFLSAIIVGYHHEERYEPCYERIRVMKD